MPDPDVYLRDNPLDNGLPHSGPLATSPDIILRQAAVADPQAAFGPTSGTVNDVNLSDNVELGQSNFLYVRVLNRGTIEAASVDVTVAWSVPMTLINPGAWLVIGTTSISGVPSGNVLAVSDAIEWLDQDLPSAVGHFCFVGWISTTGDSIPDPAAFTSLADYMDFIRNTNNYTWRNFNVVDNIPPSPSPLPLDFETPGAPKEDLPMQLEVGPIRREEIRVALELPVELLKTMGVDFRKGEEPGVGRVDVTPNGLFLKGFYPAGSRHKSRLLVQTPEGFRPRDDDLFVRQLFEGQEVGRVTWRLAPRDRHQKGCS